MWVHTQFWYGRTTRVEAARWLIASRKRSVWSLSFACEILAIPNRQTACRSHYHLLTDINIKHLYENRHVGIAVWGEFCFICRPESAETSNKLLFRRGSQNCTSMDSDSWTESDIVAGTDQAVRFIWESSTIFLGPKTLPRWGQYVSMKRRDPVSHWRSAIYRAFHDLRTLLQEVIS